MPLTQVEPVEQRPYVTLSEWAMFEVPSNGAGRPWTRHLAGWSCETQRGRVSSPLTAFDPALATCTTETGREYRLFGVPGLCPNGDWALEQWLRLHRLTELRDGTAETFVAIQDAHAAAWRVH